MRRHPKARYVAINLGTNDMDAYTGANGETVCEISQTDFYNEYAAMVKYVLDAGKVPVVPTIPSARNEYCGSQLNKMFQKLYTDYQGLGLIPGPDLWTHFWVGPCADGTLSHACRTQQQADWFPDIHPSTSGAQEYRRVWADEMLLRVYHVTP